MSLTRGNTSFFSKILPIFLMAGIVIGACGRATPTPTTPSPTLSQVETPALQPPVSKGKCGDGVCDGPENMQNCPDDCAAELIGGITSICSEPNPRGALVQDLVGWQTWLDENFVGKTSPSGNVIARYITAGDIAEDFNAWEMTHPGVSSFNYDPNDPYPYTYEIVPRMLEDAAFEEKLNFSQGVTAFRFSKDGRSLYLVWSDAGERTIDFSSELSGQVRITNTRAMRVYRMHHRYTCLKSRSL